MTEASLDADAGRLALAITVEDLWARVEARELSAADAQRILKRALDRFPAEARGALEGMLTV